MAHSSSAVPLTGDVGGEGEGDGEGVLDGSSVCTRLLFFSFFKGHALKNKKVLHKGSQTDQETNCLMMFFSFVTDDKSCLVLLKTHLHLFKFAKY